MEKFGRFMDEMRQEAAALPTRQLRAEIQVSLDVLEESMGRFQKIQSGTSCREEMTAAIDVMLCAALVTSLYVRELTTRPPERFLRVRLSHN
jgi:hypothetical protein